MLAVAGCVGSPAIVAAPSACSSLVPAEWAQGVVHTDVPPPAPPKPADAPGIIAWTLDQLKAWTGFGVSEANKLDEANGRTADTLGIVSRCEQRDAAAVKKSRPKVLGIF